MAVPTITSVSPNRGHSGGGTLLRIVGTNFQLQTAAPSSGAGPVPAPLPSVRVFVGGVEARRVRVASSTILYVVTERSDPGTALAVEVRNVGPFGETIGVETATLAAAYEYARPVFTTQSDLARLIRTLKSELVRQVFPEVVVTAHVDWTDDPVAILRGVSKAPLPCVLLAGPTLRPNKFNRTQVRPKTTIATNVSREHRAPLSDDIVFTVGALASKYSTLVAMAAALRDFQLRNPYLYFPREEGSSDLLKYELLHEGDLIVDSAPNESNVRPVTGTIVIEGFETLAAPGFESDQAIDAYPDLLEEPSVGSETL